MLANAIGTSALMIGIDSPAGARSRPDYSTLAQSQNAALHEYMIFYKRTTAEVKGDYKPRTLEASVLLLLGPRRPPSSVPK